MPALKCGYWCLNVKCFCRIHYFTDRCKMIDSLGLKLCCHLLNKILGSGSYSVQVVSRQGLYVFGYF